MPNSLFSVTTISSASIESRPSPPAKSGASSPMSSGVMSSNFNRSINNSLSFRRRSVMGVISLLHRCGGVQALPIDPRRDHAVPALDANEHEEELEAHQVREALREDVAGQDAHDRLQQAEMRLRLHE